MEWNRDSDVQLLLDSIYNGIIAIDTEGLIIYFNKTAERIFNIQSHEALKQHILCILPDTGGKLVECLKTGNPFYGEKLKGEKVILVTNITPIVSDGKISGVVSVFQDISEIEKISKELDFFKDMKNWLDGIIDSSYDGLWICDHEGKVIRINKASERINHVRAVDVIGKNSRDLVAEGLFDKSLILEVLNKRTTVTIIQQIRGGKRILATGNPIFNEKREITFVVANERDITEMDSLRNQLQETQALAEGYISKLSELEMKRADISNYIFRSEEMQRIIQIALRVAQFDSTVFLMGESGVGKGIIARMIHKYSNRKNGSFIRVDCAGIPDSLIESELFGYEKGAFTGARPEGKPGFFELANEGTLFLDEIAEIPLGSQSKLLRFLEDHEIVRIGGTKPKKIDVRVIAATNRGIEEMVSSKLFRKDLYYRLNVVPIHIPPLRERQDDILPLIFHLLKKYNETYQTKKVLSPKAIDTIRKYDFPGNIRELANIIERLVVITEEDQIEGRDLGNAIEDYTPRPLHYNSFSSEGMSLKEALERCGNLIIDKAIKKYGSQREAAKILGVNQATISRRRKRFQLPNDVLMNKSDDILH